MCCFHSFLELYVSGSVEAPELVSGLDCELLNVSQWDRQITAVFYQIQIYRRIFTVCIFVKTLGTFRL